MVREVTAFECELCRRLYIEKSQAITCEAKPALPFKYKLGQELPIYGGSAVTSQKRVPSGNGHLNLYNST